MKSRGPAALKSENPRRTCRAQKRDRRSGINPNGQFRLARAAETVEHSDVAGTYSIDVSECIRLGMHLGSVDVRRTTRWEQGRPSLTARTTGLTRPALGQVQAVRGRLRYALAPLRREIFDEFGLFEPDYFRRVRQHTKDAELVGDDDRYPSDQVRRVCRFRLQRRPSAPPATGP